MMEVMKPDDLRYVRSAPSRIHSLARFVNSTAEHPMSLVWIDQQGKGVIYFENIVPGRFQDVNTFAGHKWVFLRTDTFDRLVADGKTVWVGEPWTNHVGPERDMARRLIIHIRTPVYTLRELCLKTIRQLANNALLDDLGLPSTIQEDLQPGASFYRHIMPFQNL